MQHDRTEPDSGHAAPGRPAETRIRALIRLLDDRSPAVVTRVGGILQAEGRRALPALRRAAASPRARLRGRARAVLAAIERREVLRRLVRHGSRDELDLERALLLLGGLHTARFDARPYVRALDVMGREVRGRVERLPAGLCRAEELVAYLGRELGFEGDVEDDHHPDNIHLHRAIERRSGLPLTLSAIYLSVARRAGIEAGAVALPGHVIVRFDSRDGEAGDLLVDPFHRGRRLTWRECTNYLARNGHPPRSIWFRKASAGLLFVRQLRNLHAGYRMRGLRAQAAELRPVIETLTRYQARRLRGASGRSTVGDAARPSPPA